MTLFQRLESSSLWWLFSFNQSSTICSAGRTCTNVCTNTTCRSSVLNPKCSSSYSRATVTWRTPGRTALKCSWVQTCSCAWHQHFKGGHSTWKSQNYFGCSFSRWGKNKKKLYLLSSMGNILKFCKLKDILGERCSYNLLILYQSENARDLIFIIVWQPSNVLVAGSLLKSA